ncbi:MAG: PEP-CTERM sorting domain-containing protein [Thiobacillaceae bacterium]
MLYAAGLCDAHFPYYGAFMKNRVIGLMSVAALIALSVQDVEADAFDLNASFNSAALGTVTISGLLTETGGLVTGMTGNLGGTFGSQFGAITGIIAGGPSPFSVRNSGGDDLIADNVWQAGSPNLTANGIDFVTASGMVFNLWQDSATSFTLFSGYETNNYLFGTQQGGYIGTATVAGFYENGTGSFTQAVPEADTSAMMLAGLGLVGLQLRRRKAGLHMIHA